MKEIEFCPVCSIYGYKIFLLLSLNHKHKAKETLIMSSTCIDIKFLIRKYVVEENFAAKTIRQHQLSNIPILNI